jgi:hypothetical protein
MPAASIALIANDVYGMASAIFSLDPANLHPDQ